MSNEQLKKISKSDWLKVGMERFGANPKAWKFVCPNCGNVQTIQDFIDLREHGIEVKDAQVAYFNCIGRYDTRIPPEKIGRLMENPLSPCDYTMGGLIPLCKTVVIDEDGNENRVFEFAEE